MFCEDKRKVLLHTARPVSGFPTISALKGYLSERECGNRREAQMLKLIVFWASFPYRAIGNWD